MNIISNKRVPVDSGITLATDVHLPAGVGPFPAILMRTPYHRVLQVSNALQLVNRGYAFVVQDCRGKYDSDGVFNPLVNEADDGAATIDWIANQKWCNGRVGLWGRSYPGMVQLPAAAGSSSALRCVAPSTSPANMFTDWIRHDGCFALANMVRWLTLHTNCHTQPVTSHINWDDIYKSNLEEMAAKTGVATPLLAEWAKHDSYDEYWRALDQRLLASKIDIPCFHSGGWYDHITRGQFDMYARMSQSDQRLVVGPWGHMHLGARQYGIWDFGPDAELSLPALELQFYDYYLKDIDNGYTNSPPIRLFLMGENRWIYGQKWPLPGSTIQKWYLDSKGCANTSYGDGRLMRQTPQLGATDSYKYDPHNPVPTQGGPVYWLLNQVGPTDQRPVLNRTDILCYRSEILTERLPVVGEAMLDITITSSAEDTDFIARLCVEEPNGSITVITLASLRCRYRYSWDDPQPLVPNTPTLIRLRFNQTAYAYAPGSRIVLLVTSSDFPRIKPHTNTMASPWENIKPQVAHNAVLHGPGVTACLSLPLAEV